MRLPSGDHTGTLDPREVTEAVRVACPLATSMTHSSDSIAVRRRMSAARAPSGESETASQRPAGNESLRSIRPDRSSQAVCLEGDEPPWFGEDRRSLGLHHGFAIARAKPAQVNRVLARARWERHERESLAVG